MAERRFSDRREAGRHLARLLQHYQQYHDVVVLALPRGGVPVGYEVAEALEAPLDVFVVRKLGAPNHRELAMGAIASGGVLVLDDDVVRGLDIGPDVIEREAELERRELARRERAYRDGRAPVDVQGKVVILVDDGLATGSSMRAAILALRRHHPARVVVAVPAAPESTCDELRAEVDEVVCATTPSPFLAVGASYWDFRQTTDDEVRELLQGTPDAERFEITALRGDAWDYDVLLDAVGDARFVLIGEASHGTHEFYAERATITRRLIEEKGFCAVAAEADWPDAYAVNRYVRGQSDAATAEEALGGFKRFPAWMWRNTVVLDFVGWLRQRNDSLPERVERDKAGFYGLDLYSLYRSMHEVIAFLERIDPAAAARARERYACFDHYGEDAQSYAYAAAFGAGESCERAAVEQLQDLQRNAVEYARRDGLLAEDEVFYAEQNARAVADSEEYYRTMFGDRASSWNLRDRHMVGTLDALADHLTRQRGEESRVVVWAHNSHLGDARATELGQQGELNVGQLVREGHPGQCALIGFTTYSGTVTAADSWDGPAEVMRVRPALEGSVEHLLHGVDEPAYLVPLGPVPRPDSVLRSSLLERAIGVIYRPRTERQSHYFGVTAADQFDVLIHLDLTRALEPLERTAEWHDADVPETFPQGV